MNIDINFEDARWAEAGLAALVSASARAVFGHFGLGEAWHVSVLACGDARISELNAAFRGKPVATNVLAWPSNDLSAGVAGAAPIPPDTTDPELGDIAISFDTMQREARVGGLSLADHTRHLLVHALLHCLGYDHIDDTDAELMESAEIEILARMGVANPYWAG